LLDRQHRVHQRAALAAIVFGEGDAQQPLLGEQRRRVPRVVGRMRPGQRAILEFVLRKTGNRVRKA
jgi:hypothetical protein